jgi:hypothetical protein
MGICTGAGHSDLAPWHAQASVEPKRGKRCRCTWSLYLVVVLGRCTWSLYLVVVLGRGRVEARGNIIYMGGKRRSINNQLLSYHLNRNGLPSFADSCVDAEHV